MKVLQINSVCGVGSTGKLALQISDMLCENGIENSIAYGLFDSDRENAVKFGNKAESHLHSYISRKLCMQGYGSQFSTYKLVKYIKKLSPDVVHLHNIHGHYLNFKMLFSCLKKLDCHVVWTFHDCWPITGKCSHFTTAGCDKWKTKCYGCPQLSSYPDSTYDRSEKNYADKKKYFTSIVKMHVVTVSQWLKSVADESFFKGKDIRYIYNGVNTDTFKPVESTLRKELGIEDKFVILGVSGVWNDKKGLDKFLALSELIGDDTVIVLLGASEKLKQSLPKNVIGVSSVKDQNILAQYYSMADVLMSLSMEETFGLVVAEAMACGTPAIVMNSTASPEVIDKNTGIVVEKPEVSLIFDALLKIKAVPKTDFSDKCVERIQNNFTNRKMQDEYLKLYMELENESN